MAHLVAPGLPLAAAFALGAIVAPPDAVAATAVARRLALPRRVLTILEGESLLNDATALVSYRIAVSAALVGGATVGGALGDFAVAAVGGVAVGLAVGVPVALLRRRLDDPLLENALSLLTPFAAFLPAEEVGASGVLAVVVAGLYLGRRAPVLLTSGARLQGQALWSMVTFLLEGFVFALIGLQLPGVVEALGDDASEALGVAVAVTLTVVLTRFLWVYPATYLPRMLSRRIRAARPAAALALPVPHRLGRHARRRLAGRRLRPAHRDARPRPGAVRDLLRHPRDPAAAGPLPAVGRPPPRPRRRRRGRADRARRRRRRPPRRPGRAARARAARGRAAGARTPSPTSCATTSRSGCAAPTPCSAAAPARTSTTTARRLEDGDALADAVSTAELRRVLLDAERAELLRLYSVRDIDDEVLRTVQHQLDVEEVTLGVRSPSS